VRTTIGSGWADAQQATSCLTGSLALTHRGGCLVAA